MDREWRWSVLLLAVAAGCGAGTVTPTASALVIDDADGAGNLSAHIDVDGKAIRIEAGPTGDADAPSRMFVVEDADGALIAERDVDLATGDVVGSYAGQPFGPAQALESVAARRPWSSIAAGDTGKIVTAVADATRGAIAAHPEALATLGELARLSETLDELVAADATPAPAASSAVTAREPTSGGATPEISGPALCGIVCGGFGGAACLDVTGFLGAFFCGAASSAACAGICSGTAGRSSRPSKHAAEVCLEQYGLGWANCYSHNTYQQLCTAHWGHTGEWGHAAVQWVAAGPGGPFVLSYRIGNHVQGPRKTDCRH